MEPKAPAQPAPEPRKLPDSVRIVSPRVELTSTKGNNNSDRTGRQQFAEGKLLTIDDPGAPGGKRHIVRVSALGYCFEDGRKADMRWTQTDTQDFAVDLPVKRSKDGWELDAQHADAIGFDAAMRVMGRMNADGDLAIPPEPKLCPEGKLKFDDRPSAPILNWSGPFTQQYAADRKEYEDLTCNLYPSVNAAVLSARYFFDVAKTGQDAFPKDRAGCEVIRIDLSNEKNAESHTYFLCGRRGVGPDGKPAFYVTELLSQQHTPGKGWGQKSLSSSTPFLPIPLDNNNKPVLQAVQWRDIRDAVEQADVSVHYDRLIKAAKQAGEEILGAVLPWTPKGNGAGANRQK